MSKNDLLKWIVLLMLLIFGAHVLGSMLYLHYTTRWFDMVLHFSGGVWVAMFFTYIIFFRNFLEKKSLGVLLGVAMVVILWEFFEFYSNNFIGRIPFDIADTVSDMVLGLAGGGLALFFLRERLRYNLQ